LHEAAESIRRSSDWKVILAMDVQGIESEFDGSSFGV
jgi:hypothetical protein